MPMGKYVDSIPFLIISHNYILHGVLEFELLIGAAHLCIWV